MPCQGGWNLPIWKITPEGPKRILETRPKQEKLLEKNLEDWIEIDPSILGEPLLIVGRQVLVPDVKDRIDVLALDPHGNAVIVEIKRGKLKDPVDVQALRYASYLSKWSFEDFETLARNHLGNRGSSEFDFNELYEQFCTEDGIDEAPDVNSDQRIILVGAEVKEKLGSVALWLHEHNVRVKVVEIEFYKDGEAILLQPHVIVPTPVGRFTRTGGRYTGEGAPWISNGKDWHLKDRCSPTTSAMLSKINSTLEDNFDIDGPKWDQKYYVSYKIGSQIWLTVNTYPSTLKLRFRARAASLKAEDLAKSLGIAIFDKGESMAEKLTLPSSVSVENRTEDIDRVVLRIKEDLDIESDAFLDFLKKTYDAFPK